jgi:hypothetical protein
VCVCLCVCLSVLLIAAHSVGQVGLVQAGIPFESWVFGL